MCNMSEIKSDAKHVNGVKEQPPLTQEEEEQKSTETTSLATRSIRKKRRRGKYDKEGAYEKSSRKTKGKSNKSNLRKKHEKDARSGGMEALVPSIIGIIALGVIVMGRMGFRGRASVAGIDLGTTNSVICVQEQSKGVGKIECIPDPFNNSPIVPSVVSFMDGPIISKSSSSSNSRNRKNTSSGKRNADGMLYDSSHVVVGSQAKTRIDSHPHHTLYHAKRVLAKSFQSDAVKEMMNEVEFDIIPAEIKIDIDDDDDNSVMFRVPYHKDHDDSEDYGISLLPQQVGSYIVNHLMKLTQNYLGHDNVKSAVIAVPAKFDGAQRRATVDAFRNAGVTVTRILEEPVAAALAYGLEKKEEVDYIMVYDFGGGTLDVSILHVADGGYVEVMGSDGDDHLGGADFDAAVAHLLLEKKHLTQIVQTVTDAMTNIINQQNQQVGSTATNTMDGYDLEEMLSSSCEKLKDVPLCTISSFHTVGEKMKIQLSDFPSGGAVVEENCFGLPITSVSSQQHQIPSSISDLCSKLELIPMKMTSSEFDSACETLYNRSMLPIKSLLDDLGLEKDEIDEVVMVGGTTRMPKIRQMVKEQLGILTLNTQIDPDLTVAYGAASVID